MGCSELYPIRVFEGLIYLIFDGNTRLRRWMFTACKKHAQVQVPLLWLEHLIRLKVIKKKNIIALGLLSSSHPHYNALQGSPLKLSHDCI